MIKHAASLMLVLLVSACVGVHPRITNILVQCGEPPTPQLNANGQLATQLSNLTIAKGGNVFGNAVWITYDGSRAEAKVLEEQADFFRYQFESADGELLEISGDLATTNMTLKSVTVPGNIEQCKKIDVV